MNTAFYKNASKTYELMEKESYVNEQEERLFVGNFSDAIKQGGISSRYYSQIRQLLLSPHTDPCIEIRQRGNSGQPSVILLRHPPPPEWGGITAGDLTGGALSATMVAELEAEVKRLQAWRETLGGMNIAEVLRDFEKRLIRLERGYDGKE